ncbi:MAG TPA: pyridoxal-phosphate dependent enzyme, partial [Luteibaculaceae bacterium]|nr:pyridoxal-phosphate dependent enzyme [Luteibaculaceae bacterium]
MNELFKRSVLQRLSADALFPGVEVFVLREDLIHPEVSGNKLRKLAGYLEELDRGGYSGIYTAGGAYSNHIAATAAAGKLFGFQTAAIIRGDELNEQSNPTLQRAAEHGMQLRFVDRARYRELATSETLPRELQVEGRWLWVPEGGQGERGEKGVAALVENLNGDHFDSAFVALGTGTTFCGLLGTAVADKLVGVSVVRDSAMWEHVQRRARQKGVGPEKFSLLFDRDFGGYNRFN